MRFATLQPAFAAPVAAVAPAAGVPEQSAALVRAGQRKRRLVVKQSGASVD